MKPTRPYGDVFEYDPLPLKPGEQRTVQCSGSESTWRPTINADALALYQTDPHVHALVQVIAEEWTHPRLATRAQILEFLVETLGQFEAARAGEIQRLTAEVSRLIGEQTARSGT